MSAWEGKNQILANIPLNKDELAKRSEVKSFMQLREGLDIQLPRAEAFLRMKEEEFAELHTPCGPLNAIKGFFLFEKARRELKDARDRNRFIHDAISLHEIISCKIGGSECCCACHLDLLLRLFTSHMDRNGKFFEDMPNSSLPFIISKTNRFRSLIMKMAELDGNIFHAV